jgi:hypothetical protein
VDVARADRPAVRRPWWTPLVALVAFDAAVWLVAASLDEIVVRIDAKYGGITATT